MLPYNISITSHHITKQYVQVRLCHMNTVCKLIVLVHLDVSLRCAVYSSHQFIGEVTNQVTNFKLLPFLFQVTKMCCIIQLWFQVWNVNRNWTIQHILVTWNRKIGDLKLVIWLVTSPKNCWLEWTARLNSFDVSYPQIAYINNWNSRMLKLSQNMCTFPSVLTHG